MNTNCRWRIAGMLLVVTESCLGQAPSIVAQPQSQTNIVAGTARFEVTATGAQPLAYQWEKSNLASFESLPGCTNRELILTTLQSASQGDYRVVVTNTEGAVTSAVAHLTVIVPPAFTTHPADRIVAEGANLTITARASGTAPQYQWFREGVQLADATSSSLALAGVQRTNAGTYTVVATNLAGAVTSRAAQLSVAEPGRHTNAQGRVVPYRICVPANYDVAQRYPLVLFWHGSGGVGTNNLSQLTDTTSQYVFLAATNAVRHPSFFLMPQIPLGGAADDPQVFYRLYFDVVMSLMARLQTEFNIDSERLYVTGLSMGGHYTWTTLALAPDVFAAGVPVCGGWFFTNLTAEYQSIRRPIWNFHASDDATVPVGLSDTAIHKLRSLGHRSVYTRYNSGGHFSWVPAYATPGLVDWVMAQRLSAAPTNEPLISITTPPWTTVYTTGATNLNLAGTAAAFGQPISSVICSNLANSTRRVASNPAAWVADAIPLELNATNLILVTASTTSWAPANGGSTTFNEVLRVVQSPLRASLAMQGTSAVLDWIGGRPPYRIERATDLMADDWAQVQSNAVPPLPIPLEGNARFYRVVGH